MVGHLGAAPSISPIRTARIAVFLVPNEKRGATGNRTPTYAMPLRCLALGRWPEMDAHPVLAPGNSVLQTDGSATLPCARFLSGVTGRPSRITSAAIESINAIIQTARRRARDFRNFDNLKAICYWLARHLDLHIPSAFSHPI